ncbi:HEAT repeat domain-containing protein [Desulfobulbus sp. US1]|nr:HEAT repeat domain-containing protein [Desulfobulbus sp. US4]MCW5209768.1 HEAT repeat domain-containing protein [Desulfobulbus sp. US1]WLE95923.1 MAG: HEAT repeat domain-containing protein [Candidatus Electrothrix communis]
MQDTTRKYAADPRSSEELLAAHRQEMNAEDDTREAIGVLHFRGGWKEFELGRQLTESEDPEDRVIGADILAQLGWEKRSFHEESVQILINLLNDPDHNVIHYAAISLGHRNDARAIPPLVELALHEDPLVRFGVTFGLSCHDDEQAIAALIQLSRDDDNDVRNWAMFALAAQTDMDGPDIREALAAGLQDPEVEIRGEALIGLARRKDVRVFAELVKEWALHDVSILSIEAAEKLADPDLIPHLMNLQESLDFSGDQYFEDRIQDALEACEQQAGLVFNPSDYDQDAGQESDQEPDRKPDK